MFHESKTLCLQVEAKTAELKQQYEEKLSMKEELRKKAEFNEMMLNRASQLVDGLAGERERWLLTVKDLEERLGFLVGDVLIASAFLSYMGPFLSHYREEIVHKQWLAEVGVVFWCFNRSYFLPRTLIKIFVTRLPCSSVSK